MSIDIKRKGYYELFETTRHHQILVLERQEFYALVEGECGQIIVKSDSNHQQDRPLSEGDYVLFIAKDYPQWIDNVEHLELQQGRGQYKIYILPNGFPTERDQHTKLIESTETVSSHQVSN